MNQQVLRTLLKKPYLLRLYSTGAPGGGGGGSKLLPTILLLTGGSAGALGGYYYYDPNAELFKQAKTLFGVDTQSQQQQAQKAIPLKQQNLGKQESNIATPKPTSVNKNEKGSSSSSSSSSKPATSPSTSASVPVPPVPAPPSSNNKSSSSTAPTSKTTTAPSNASTAANALPVAAAGAGAAAAAASATKPQQEKPATSTSTTPAAAASGGSGDSAADVVPKKVLVTALRAQQEALTETHEAKLKVVQKEYDRKLANAQKVIEADRVVELRGKYEKASAALSAIEKGIEARSEQNTRAKRLRALWAQVNALHARVNHPEYHGGSITVIDKSSLLKAIEVPDKFVVQMVDSLPSEPVHSLESLKERFYNDLQPVAKQVSLIKDGEPFSLFKYACGKVLSWGVVEVKKSDPTPVEELKSTSQVLDTARCLLEKGDLLTAAVAVNQLTGLPRQVASDWLKDARTLLETNQTLFALMTYAASNNVF